MAVLRDPSSFAAQFARDGVMLVPRLIPQPVVTEMRDFMLALTGRVYGSNYRPIHTDNPFKDLKDVTCFVAIAHTLKSSGALDALLGPTSFLRLPPGGRAVYPNHSEGLGPVHQDGGRLRDLDHFVTVWVPFVEIDHACGGLGFYPSLGHAGEIPEGSNGIDVGSAVPIPVRMSPGDALFFHKWAPHVSMPNTSTRIRYSMDLRFYSTLKEFIKPALDLQKWEVVHPPSR